MSSGKRKKSKSKKSSANNLDEYFPSDNAFEGDDTGGGGTSYRKKSLTSGISTLFRKQPSPVPSAAYQYGDDYSGGGGRSRAGSMDNTRTNPMSPQSTKSAPAVHATVPDSTQHDFEMTSSPGKGRRRSKSKSRKVSAVPDQVSGRHRVPTPTAEASEKSLGELSSVISAEDRSRGARILHSFSGDTSFSEGTGTEATSYYESDYDDRKRGRSQPRSRSRPRNIVRLPRRFRGFSTSISNLFLDESIVCGAMSCCGLLLSSRTEHLLNERNVKRGLTRRGKKEGGQRAPSRILGVSLLITIVLLTSTYVIWGFGNNYEAAYEGGYDNGGNDDGGNVAYNDDGGDNDDAADDDAAEEADGDDGGDADDGAAAQDDFYGYDDDAKQDDRQAQADDGDDAAAQVDDAAANDDGNAQADDGAAQNDDANDDNNDDEAAAADDFYADDYNADDYNNRNLVGLLPFSPKVGAGSTKYSRKHQFNGIMKVRDYREYVIDPTFNVMHGAYNDLMSQFGEEAPEVSDTTRGSTIQPKTQDNAVRHLEDSYGANDNDNLSGSVRAVFVVIFLFMLGVVGRRRRMRTRFAILRSRAQDDHLYYAALLSNPSSSIATPEGTVMENFHEREDKYDGACSHTLFGCYPVDNQPSTYADYGDDDETLQTDDSEFTAKKKRRGGDFMNRAAARLFDCCCGVLCKCWCQLSSVCALAQEARETRLLLPPKLQRIDLITHQPFHEYASDVNNIRRRYMEDASRTFMQHYAALSQLSRYIILTFVLTLILVTVTMLVHPTEGFVMGDLIVLVATFVQSFFVLIVVFGIFHKSDLSLDAVIKFFAVGFIICVPMGFVLEGIFVNMIVSLMYGIYYLFKISVGEGFDAFVVQYRHIFWILGELLNAYLNAALIEELCKYYGFRFIEHPDLIFLTGLDRSAQQAQIGGGKDEYTFDSQVVSEFSRNNEMESEDAMDRKNNKRSKKSKMMNEDDEDEPELRTLRQQAAAITTGMICVAVGLACAENFMYVFFLGGTGGVGSLSEEWTILLFRSIFPVHALSAAMQSINMITKFIEEKHGGSKSIGVGKIIMPAVLLHGTFDAILMSINAYVETAWDTYLEENGGNADSDAAAPYNSFLVNLVAWVGIVMVMVVSFGWYTYQNKVQKLRLKNIEMQERAGSPRYNSSNPGLV